MLLIRTLYILYNQAFAASYNYFHNDPAYGTTRIPVYGKGNVDVMSSFCSECGTQTDGQESSINPANTSGDDSTIGIGDSTIGMDQNVESQSGTLEESP